MKYDEMASPWKAVPRNLAIRLLTGCITTARDVPKSPPLLSTEGAVEWATGEWGRAMQHHAGWNKAHSNRMSRQTRWNKRDSCQRAKYLKTTYNFMKSSTPNISFSNIQVSVQHLSRWCHHLSSSPGYPKRHPPPRHSVNVELDSENWARNSQTTNLKTGTVTGCRIYRVRLRQGVLMRWLLKKSFKTLRSTEESSKYRVIWDCHDWSKAINSSALQLYVSELIPHQQNKHIVVLTHEHSFKQSSQM